MFGCESSWNEGKKLLKPAKRSRDERRPSTNHPTFGGGRSKIGQIGFAKIRHNGNGANFLQRIVGVNRLLDRGVAGHTRTRRIDEVARESDLKWPYPERAL